ncbi:uncharacterized protein LOC122278380 [Carya illinoinensis]|uniref:Late embryogenesis abundant protein LEA-2 subgroup domain-containing protein n=1 Tax=Carya illinoinensis TaxID=32201 RepID=A0A8T1PEF0_CARIL|nr:uncharacterized protein LOC122278380 [Carya illinoinensis]KAG6638970.1 hypothetical protein CIPAW_10G068700 [Carya illinoinensis]KAG6691536.1 hypothetical protein I3842_10G068100 [Carya illinoinensis]
MGSGRNSHRTLKIKFTVLVVAVVLFFTVLKPKDPKIIAQPISLEKLKLQVLPVFGLNLTLGILVTVDNRNYGSFKHDASTAHVSYRGNVVAETPIEADTIPARRKQNISTSVEITADKLLTNLDFWVDFAIGILNFTSGTTLHGKASLFKLFKTKVSSYTTCHISILIQTKRVDSVCKSRVKLYTFVYWTPV